MTHQYDYPGTVPVGAPAKRPTAWTGADTLEQTLAVAEEVGIGPSLDGLTAEGARQLAREAIEMAQLAESRGEVDEPSVTVAVGIGPGGEPLSGLETVLAEFLPWAAETFPHSTPASCAAHLRKEVCELEAAPTDAEELADCLFLVVDGAQRAGVDIVQALRGKLAKLRTRTWGEPDAEGVVEHVRPSAQKPTAPTPPTGRTRFGERLREWMGGEARNEVLAVPGLGTVLGSIASSIDRDERWAVEAACAAEIQEVAADLERKVAMLVEELRYVAQTGPADFKDVLDAEPFLERLGELFGSRLEPAQPTEQPITMGDL